MQGRCRGGAGEVQGRHYTPALVCTSSRGAAASAARPPSSGRDEATQEASARIAMAFRCDAFVSKSCT